MTVQTGHHRHSVVCLANWRGLTIIALRSKRATDILQPIKRQRPLLTRMFVFIRTIGLPFKFLPDLF
jgi:hypothetical protein